MEFGSGSQADRARSGMFDGLRKHDTNGLLDFNYTNRAAGGDGRWLTVEGRNLGLDNREAFARWRGLGDFNLKGEYSEITRHDPRTINSSLSGAGTTNPTVQFLAVPGTGTNQNYELKRKAYSLDGSKYFGNFQIEFNYKQEDKDGERFWGRGMACNSATAPAVGTYQASGICSNNSGQTALLMLPEPVNSTIRQLDAKVNYSDGKLNLSAGYYGNYYTNNNGSLTANILNPAGAYGNLNGGTQTNANLMSFMATPMALWPDSQANQLFAAGNYRFTPHTSMNFKYSYTHATQNESFGAMGLSLGAPPTNPGLNAALGNTRGDLGGVLNTQKAQIGFATQPFAKAHLHGDLEYSSTDNKTPISMYNAQVASATPTYTTWTNSAMSPRKWGAKLEGNYMLPQNYLATLGAKWEHDDVGAWTQSDAPGGISALRQKSETLSYRGELRKTISDTLTGAVSLNESRTSGASSWLKPTGGINPSRVQRKSGLRIRRHQCLRIQPYGANCLHAERQPNAENSLERELGAHGPAFRAGLLRNRSRRLPRADDDVGAELDAAEQLHPGRELRDFREVEGQRVLHQRRQQDVHGPFVGLRRHGLGPLADVRRRVPGHAHRSPEAGRRPDLAA